MTSHCSCKEISINFCHCRRVSDFSGEETQNSEEEQSKYFVAFKHGSIGVLVNSIVTITKHNNFDKQADI